MTRLHQSWTEAMRAGDWERAWSLCDAALAARDPATRDHPTLPYHERWVWDGRPVDGRHVLVRCYHGLGDTIMFARFLPRLAERAASVTLEVQPRLAFLFERFPGIDRVIPFDVAAPAPPAEVDVEIMELAHALRARPSAVRPPYLRVRHAALPGGTIGLCWEAGEWDPDRAVPPGLLRPLAAAVPAISLVSAPADLPVLNPDGCPFDMATTAALVAGCELVVTVDTMIAHLAGAMGKPVWLLLKHAPDWRWAPETGRSAWYPSFRLYPQPAPGDWRTVADRVAAALACHRAARLMEGSEG
jgi:hypothetical protein